MNFRVCMAPYAYGCFDVLKELGYELDKETETFPIKEMTKGDMFGLIERALEMGVGVMIQHPYPRGKNDTPSPWDYLIYVDTTKGRFRQR